MRAKEKASDDPQVEAPTAETTEADQAAPATFQTEGDVPAVGMGGATPATATASQLAFGTKATADSASIDHGVHQPEEYKHACEAAGKPDKWHESYRNGHTGASAWTEPGKVGMKFDLKRGHSASSAISEWFKGPTIADFRTISVAEQLDELRDELGDNRFDTLFGSADAHQDGAIPGTQRLSIAAAMYTTPFIDQMKAVARKDDDKINKPEAAKPEAAPPAEEKKPKPGKDALAKHDTKHDQHDNDVTSKRELGFGRDDLERA